MTASDKFGIGDTVTVEGKVTYASTFGDSVTFVTESGVDLNLDSGDLILVKKVVPPQPAKGTVFTATSKYGTNVNYLVGSDNKLTLLDYDGNTYKNYTSWESLHTNGYTIVIH